MPHLVGRTDGRIPSLDHRFVHVVHRSERPAEQSKGAAMSKVRIRGEEDRHAYSDLHADLVHAGCSWEF
jgi:hypothetical protein